MGYEKECGFCGHGNLHAHEDPCFECYNCYVFMANCELCEHHKKQGAIHELCCRECRWKAPDHFKSVKKGKVHDTKMPG